MGNAVHQLGQRFRSGHGARHQLVELHGVRRRFLGALNLRDGERGHLIDGVDGDAPEPLQGNLYRVARQVNALVHPGGHPNAANEMMWINGLVSIGGGHDQRHNQSRFLMRTQEGQIFGRAHLYGDRSQREDDGGAQRHQRERGGQLSAKNFFFTLPARHGKAGESGRRSRHGKT